MAAIKLLQFVIGFIGVTLLFWAGLYTGFWWDGRPANTPRIHVPLLFGCCTWTAPESLKAKMGDLLAAEAAAVKRAQAVAAVQAALNAKASAKEATAQARIVYLTKTLTKEVPGVITVQMDKSYPLSVGFVRLHDAAALGLDVSQVPAPAGQPDDAASSIASSVAAAAIIANYGEARADAERLTALQKWIVDTTANLNQGSTK